MIQLIIGRDAQTGKIKVVNGTQMNLYGNPATVPPDVSRQHCQLTINDDGTMTLANIKAVNVTWVNGVEIQSKQIRHHDKVQLGPSQFNLPLSEIVKKEVPKTIDITPLKAVWECYNKQNIAIRKRQHANGMWASVPMVFSMLGGVVGGVLPVIREFAFGFTAVALVIMAYGLYRRFTDKSIEQQEEIKKQFQRDYVCPQCHHFMGYQDYDLLKQNTACPYCKTKFKK